MTWRPKWGVATVVLVLIAASASAAPAAGSVTIGQIAPLNAPSTCGGAYRDLAQPGPLPGNPNSLGYIVPALPPAASLAINSWSHSAFNGPGQQITMKVWRLVSGSTYQAVGHDGPRTLNGGVVNTFSGISVPVQPGDVLGLNIAPPQSACQIPAGAGECYLASAGTDTPDGGTVNFLTSCSGRANISAVVAPTNAFTLGKLKRNKKKGTATLTVNVPNPGELSVAGKGVDRAEKAGRAVAGGAVISKRADAAGNVKLLISPKPKQKKKLKKTGKVTVKPKITYLPFGGEAASQTTKVKLKRKRKKR